MDSVDTSKLTNYLLVGFVVFVIIMVAIVARMVSTFMAKKNATSTYANTSSSPKTSLETVHTMTVRLSKLAQEYNTVPANEQDKAFDIISTLAQAREQAMITMIEENPIGIFSTLFPEEIRTQLPVDLQSLIEHAVIVEGTIKIKKSADHEQNSQNHYALVARNGEEFLLYFTEAVPEEMTGGAFVRVNGVQIDNKIIVQSAKKIS